MKLIVGLGNPGRRYHSTPHNVGYEAVDQLAERHGLKWKHSARIEADFAGGFIRGVDSMLLKPRTYMNLSGKSVAPLVKGENLRTDRDLLVVLDDVELPLGRLRLRPEGSAGGHNGLRSLIAALGSQEFPRLRLGVAPPGGREGEERGDLARYVLAKWGKSQRPEVDRMVDRAADAAEAWLVEDDMQRVMSAFNAAPA